MSFPCDFLCLSKKVKVSMEETILFIVDASANLNGSRLRISGNLVNVKIAGSDQPEILLV